MQTKGYAVTAANKAFEPFSWQRRTVNENDVVIEIEFCGICHSDVHQARDEWGGSHYPMVPGHEIVGTVKEVGKTVSKFKVGDKVGVGCMVDSCQKCHSCDDDLEQFCENGFSATYNGYEQDGVTLTQGGYANNIIVREEFVLKIPENLDAAAVAPLLCAGITTYSPLIHVGLKPGDKVGVNGLGGLGHMAVKIAVSMGAEVTVFSRSIQKKQDAERMGAKHFVLTSDVTQMTKAAKTYDYILNTVSAKHDVTALLSSLKRDGVMILVGVADKPLEVASFPLIGARRSILGSLIGGIAQTQEMLDHCGKHGIVSEIEIINPDQINQAYDRIINSDVKYRFVIDCRKFNA